MSDTVTETAPEAPPKRRNPLLVILIGIFSIIKFIVVKIFSLFFKKPKETPPPPEEPPKSKAPEYPPIPESEAPRKRKLPVEDEEIGPPAPDTQPKAKPELSKPSTDTNAKPVLDESPEKVEIEPLAPEPQPDLSKPSIDTNTKPTTDTPPEKVEIEPPPPDSPESPPSSEPATSSTFESPMEDDEIDLLPEPDPQSPQEPEDQKTKKKHRSKSSKKDRSKHKSKRTKQAPEEPPEEEQAVPERPPEHVFEEKKLRMRAAAMDELVTSEKNFCNYLQQMINDFKPALAPILDQDTISLFFQNIPSLIMLSKQMLAEFEKQHARGPEHAEIGGVFTSNIHFLKVFVPYIQLYPEALMKLTTLLEKNKKFKTACQKLEEDHQPMNSLLIMPIQRMAKYVPLVKEILKHTPDWHPDHAALQEALKSLEEASQRADVKINEANRRQTLYKIQSSVQGCPVLLDASRTFIGEWECVEERYKMLLLSDMVLLVKDKKSLGRAYTQFKRQIPLSCEATVGVDGENVIIQNGDEKNEIHLKSGANDVKEKADGLIESMLMLKKRISNPDIQAVQ